MKLLFLRGQVPQDRDPQEIVFDTLEKCDDVWTHLAYSLLGPDDEGEIWYWGNNRLKQWKPNFLERWIPSFSFVPSYKPDVIFCRGGFLEYHPFLKCHPDAFKIYYGAGRRFLPQKGFSDYNLVLQDSSQQVEICKDKFPSLRAETYIKPTIDALFCPKDTEKQYDVCFPANGQQEHMKGHSFVFSTFPKDLKILNLGNPPKKTKVPREIKRTRVLRSQMPNEYSKCKMGIVCCSSNVDSCPRVIPEMLACNLPIVVLDETRFWTEKYISTSTGIVSSKKDFWNNVQYVLDNLDAFSPKEHYDQSLSIKTAATHIRRLIGQDR